jgi:hypothetical protein
MQDEDDPGLIWISMFRSGVLTRPATPFWMAGLHVFQHPGDMSAQAMIGIIGGPCNTGANHAPSEVAVELIASRFAPYTADPLRQIKHG